MTRPKSTPRKRQSGSGAKSQPPHKSTHQPQQQQPESQPETQSAQAETPPVQDLKCLLRVRLPPTAHNGIFSSVYSPAKVETPDPRGGKKHVRITFEEEECARGKHKSSVSLQERSNKERRVSDAVMITPRMTAQLSEEMVDVSNGTNQTPEWLELGKAYRGFCPFGQPEEPIPRISYTSISPLQFFQQFVSRRRPCILTSKNGSPEGLAELAPMLNKWASLDYLKQSAGKLTVKVEVREKNENFGEGKTTKMEFSQFLDALAEGKEEYYMTTQSIHETRDGPTKLAGDVLTHSKLAEEYPHIPSLLGHLVAYQHNLWMGYSQEGSSTGLHHDFHDNFYVLLRGRKSFRLYSPRCGEALSTSQPIRKIHSNGLICYEDRRRSDGAHDASVLAWRVEQSDSSVKVLEARKDTIQMQLSGLEALRGAVALLLAKRNVKGSSKDPIRIKELPNGGLIELAKQLTQANEIRLVSIQSEINSKTESMKLVDEYIQSAVARKESLIEQQLAAEAEILAEDSCSTGDFEDDFDWNGIEDAPMENSLPGSSLSFLESTLGEKEKLEMDIKRKELKLMKQVKHQPCVDEWIATDDESVDDSPMGHTPAHFSSVSTLPRISTPSMASLPSGSVEDAQKQLLQSYTQVDLEASEMLYLPASWFHEVISKSVDGPHIAFNFWFHPPSTSSFKSPYTDEYWAAKYRGLCESLERDLQAVKLESLKTECPPVYSLAAKLVMKGIPLNMAIEVALQKISVAFAAVSDTVPGTANTWGDLIDEDEPKPKKKKKNKKERAERSVRVAYNKHQHLKRASCS